MKEDEYESLKVVNVVASGSIAERIDLEMVTSTIEGCTFNSKRFPGAVFHMQDPKFVVLLFSSGKVVLTGFQSIEDVPIGLHNLLDKMKTTGLSCIDEPQVQISNLVCSYNLGNTCNLNRVVMTFHYENVEYEPEVFPGLVFRIPDPKIVILLFSSGNIIITGGKNLEGVKRGLSVFKEKMKSVM